jgi:hypothetical protein
MVDALEIRDQKSLRRWHGDRPVVWAWLIALRAALRVFPLVIQSTGRSTVTNQARNQELTLAVWRCLLISAVAHKYPTDSASASAASTAASAAASAAADAASASAAASAASAAEAVGSSDAYAYVASASAASDAASAVDAASAASDAASAVDAASAASAASASAYVSAASASASAWRAVTADARWLEKNGKGLEDQPLWLEDAHASAKYLTGFPDWVLKPFETFADSELARTTSWGLIADWYRARLVGAVNAEPTGLFHQKIERQIAKQPDKFWNREDPQEVMDAIARTAGWKPDGGQNQSRSKLSNVEDEVIQMMSDVSAKLGEFRFNGKCQEAG